MNKRNQRIQNILGWLFLFGIIVILLATVWLSASIELTDLLHKTHISVLEYENELLREANKNLYEYFE